MTPPAAAVAPRRVLLDGLTFPECPRWHDDRLWLSDVHAHRVLRVDLDGAVEEVVKLDGERPAGLGFLPDGSLLIVGLTSRTLLRVAASGGEPAHYADLRGLCAGFLNDMVVDAEGRAYVGSRNGGAPGTDAIVLVEPGGAARVVAENLTSPNGMVITPAGDELIVAETRLGRLTRYALGIDGSLSDRRTRAVADRQILDGICLDAEGAVWGAAGQPARCASTPPAGRSTRSGPSTAMTCWRAPSAGLSGNAVPGRDALRPRRAPTSAWTRGAMRAAPRAAGSSSSRPCPSRARGCRERHAGGPGRAGHRRRARDRARGRGRRPPKARTSWSPHARANASRPSRTRSTPQGAPRSRWPATSPTARRSWTPWPRPSTRSGPSTSSPTSPRASRPSPGRASSATRSRTTPSRSGTTSSRPA